MYMCPTFTHTQYLNAPNPLPNWNLIIAFPPRRCGHLLSLQIWHFCFTQKVEIMDFRKYGFNFVI